MKRYLILQIPKGGAGTKWLLANVKGDRILDLGFAEALATHKGFREQLLNSFIVGLDINLEFIKGSGFEDTAILGDANCLPIKEASFDTVFMGEIIEHLWHPRKAVLEAYRVLKPNGRLILTTPNIYHLPRVLNYLLTGKDSMVSPDHTIEYNRASIIKLLEDSGFKVEKLEAMKLRLHFRTPVIDVILQIDKNFPRVGKTLYLAARKSFNDPNIVELSQERGQI